MIKIHNTMTRKLETIKKPNIGFYACGPTVYDYAHIGNFRTFISEDMIKRYLILRGHKVKHIMNITDVGHLTSDSDTGGDKIEIAAKKKKKNAYEIADFYTKEFIKDIKKLRILKPDKMPKATDNIKEMILMVKKIESKGLTYRTEDGIYFDTSKIKNYGKLSKLNSKNIKAGKRVKLGGKKNPTDFALWKFSKEKRQMEWDSVFGKGFPGWHIECSAMSLKYLKTPIDLHMGGIDHIPIHHTNEIAQSENFLGKKFVLIWAHVNFMNVNGEKMSKSLGNIYKIDEIKDYIGFRYLCLSSHYRSQINFTFKALQDSSNSVDSINNFLSRLKEYKPVIGKNSNIEKICKEFYKHMDNDFKTPMALASVFKLIRKSGNLMDKKMFSKEDKKTVVKFMKDFNYIFQISETEKILTKQEIEMIKKREEFRKSGNYDDADKIRDILIKKGIEIKDSKKGTSWTKK